MKLDLEKLEDYLKERIFPELEDGRADFDKPHTVAVVHWLKEIIKNTDDLNLDKVVLLIAAYSHDWGYAGLFKKGQQLKYCDVKAMKSEHMKLGAEKLERFLSDNFFSFLTSSQKQRAVHLVAIHDKLDALKEVDELILMEADTLGALDINFVKPTFDSNSNKKYMQGVHVRRLPKFITAFGKKNAKDLIEKRNNFFITHTNNKAQ